MEAPSSIARDTARPAPTSPTSLPPLPAAKAEHPLMERVNALATTGNALQKRIAAFLLQNTLPVRWNVENSEETLALEALISKVEQGAFTDWRAFSNALRDHVKKYHPARPKPEYNRTWFLARREEEDRMRKGALIAARGGSRRTNAHT